MTRKPKLLVTRRLPKAVEDRMHGNFDFSLNHDDTIYSRQHLVRLSHGVDAILAAAGDNLDSVTIRQLDAGVRMIATFSVGTEHIDLKAASDRGIVVTNTPGVLTEATADITMLLLLAAARRAHEGEKMVRSGQWAGWAPTQLMGAEIFARNLGIVGMGRIGLAVARRARAFGMKIHYHNRNRLPEDIEAGATYHSRLDELLARSRFLSLHCPATPETRYLLDGHRLALLPRGAIVVNTARGSVIVDDDLIKALKSGHISAAGLDVYKGEPDVNPGYLDLDNVFLLPHLGSSTVETRNAMGFMVLDNLDAFFAGDDPPNRVA